MQERRCEQEGIELCWRSKAREEKKRLEEKENEGVKNERENKDNDVEKQEKNKNN